MWAKYNKPVGWIWTRGCLASSGFFCSSANTGGAELRALHGKNYVWLSLLLPPVNPKTVMPACVCIYPLTRNGRDSSSCTRDTGYGDLGVLCVVRVELFTGCGLVYLSPSATSRCLCPVAWFLLQSLSSLTPALRSPLIPIPNQTPAGVTAQMCYAYSKSSCPT